MELRVEQQEAQLQRDSVSVRPPSAHADAQRALSVSARRAERPEVGRQRQCVRGGQSWRGCGEGQPAAGCVSRA